MFAHKIGYNGPPQKHTTKEKFNHIFNKKLCFNHYKMDVPGMLLATDHI